MRNVEGRLTRLEQTAEREGHDDDESVIQVVEDPNWYGTQARLAELGICKPDDGPEVVEEIYVRGGRVIRTEPGLR
jgi:hypothetical protein